MKRREFITLLGGGAAAWPPAASGQQPGIPLIGYFSGRSADAETPLRVPFLKALEESGFAAERNIAINEDKWDLNSGTHSRCLRF